MTTVQRAIEIAQEVINQTENRKLLVRELTALGHLYHCEEAEELEEEHKCIVCDAPMDSEEWVKEPICLHCQQRRTN